MLPREEDGFNSTVPEDEDVTPGVPPGSSSLSSENKDEDEDDGFVSVKAEDEDENEENGFVSVKAEEADPSEEELLAFVQNNNDLLNLNYFYYLSNLAKEIPIDSSLAKKDYAKDLLKHCGEGKSPCADVAYKNLHEEFFFALLNDEDRDALLLSEELIEFVKAIYVNKNGALRRTAKFLIKVMTDAGVKLLDTSDAAKKALKDRLGRKKGYTEENYRTPAYSDSLRGKIEGMVLDFHPIYTTSLPSTREYAYLEKKKEPQELRFGTQGQYFDEKANDESWFRGWFKKFGKWLYNLALKGKPGVNPFFELWLRVQKENSQKKKGITHIYFNNLGRDRESYEGTWEKTLTAKLEALEDSHTNIAVITLPADKGLMSHDLLDNKKTENSEISKDAAIERMLAIAMGTQSKEKEETPIQDFYISPRVKELLYEEQEAKILTRLINESFDALGFTDLTKLNQEQHLAVYFYFIKFALTDFIIHKLDPDSFNMSCKDAIDRAGASSAFYNLIKSILMKNPMTEEEFVEALQAAPVMVKNRFMNHHEKVIRNALFYFVQAFNNKQDKLQAEQNDLQAEQDDLRAPGGWLYNWVKGIEIIQKDEIPHSGPEISSDDDFEIVDGPRPPESEESATDTENESQIQIIEPNSEVDPKEEFHGSDRESKEDFNLIGSEEFPPSNDEIKDDSVEPAPVNGKVKELSANSTFDFAFFKLSKAAEQADENYHVEIIEPNNDEWSDEEWNAKPDKPDPKVYGARFTANGQSAVLTSAGSDSNESNMKNIGATPLPRVLNKIRALQKENPDEVYFVPLAECQNTWKVLPRQHWTMLMIQENDCYFFDPCSDTWGMLRDPAKLSLSIIYSLDPLKKILDASNFTLQKNNIFYLGWQKDKVNCGRFSSEIIGMAATSIFMEKDEVEEDEIEMVYIASDLQKKQHPSAEQLVQECANCKIDPEILDKKSICNARGIEFRGSVDEPNAPVEVEDKSELIQDLIDSLHSESREEQSESGEEQEEDDSDWVDSLHSESGEEKNEEDLFLPRSDENPVPAQAPKVTPSKGWKTALAVVGVVLGLAATLTGVGAALGILAGIAAWAVGTMIGVGGASVIAGGVYVYLATKQSQTKKQQAVEQAQAANISANIYRMLPASPNNTVNEPADEIKDRRIEDGPSQLGLFSGGEGEGRTVQGEKAKAPAHSSGSGCFPWSKLRVK